MPSNSCLACEINAVVSDGRIPYLRYEESSDGRHPWYAAIWEYRLCKIRCASYFATTWPKGGEDGHRSMLLVQKTLWNRVHSCRVRTRLSARWLGGRRGILKVPMPMCRGVQIQHVIAVHRNGPTARLNFVFPTPSKTQNGGASAIWCSDYVKRSKSGIPARHGVTQECLTYMGNDSDVHQIADAPSKTSTAGGCWTPSSFPVINLRIDLSSCKDFHIQKEITKLVHCPFRI